jgi:hypothetical protein
VAWKGGRWLPQGRFLQCVKEMEWAIEQCWLLHANSGKAGWLCWMLHFAPFAPSPSPSRQEVTGPQAPRPRAMPSRASVSWLACKSDLKPEFETVVAVRVLRVLRVPQCQKRELTPNLPLSAIQPGAHAVHCSPRGNCPTSTTHTTVRLLQ